VKTENSRKPPVAGTDLDMDALRKTLLPGFYERHIKIQVYRLALVGFVLLAWHLVSGWLIPTNWIASPSLVADRAWSWISSGILFFHLRVTFLEMIVGAVIGTCAAVITGFMLSSSSLLAEALLPYISALYGIPRIALAPLFIMWFGIGITSKIALVIVVVFFLVFFNAFVGAREVDRVYVDTMKVMGAGKWDIFLKVIFPHSAGWIFVGLKFALPRALIAAVVGEIISSNRGLGYLLEESGGRFDVAGILVAVGVLAVLGVLMNMGLNRLEQVINQYRFLDS
jgi:NitT/TauT family transport system permease protein